MKNGTRTQSVSRDHILKLLSGEDVARMRAMAAAHLLEGEEYVNLAHLDWGVRIARGRKLRIVGALPRRVVHGDTWMEILFALPARVRTSPTTPDP